MLIRSYRSIGHTSYARKRYCFINAEEASRLVDVCTTEAEDGNRAAVEVSGSMEEISGSRKKFAGCV